MPLDTTPPSRRIHITLEGSRFMLKNGDHALLLTGVASMEEEVCEAAEAAPKAAQEIRVAEDSRRT